MSGAKVTYAPNTTWSLAGLICNGWQHIQRIPGNSLPAFGSQVRHSTEHNTTNWSTFIGTDDPDSTRRLRIFNNFYHQAELSKKISLLIGLDIGLQQKSRHSSTYNTWYSLVIITRYRFEKHWAAAFRAAYYNDESGVIIPSPATGFKTSGVSANLDYAPVQAILCRFEVRWLHGKDAFITEQLRVDNNVFVSTSMAIKLE